MNCSICTNKLTGKQTKFCSTRCKSQDGNVKYQTYELQQKRAKERKIQAIQEFGGSCQSCGYNRNYSALAFHHKDPTKKDFGIDSRKFSNTSWTKLKNELAKCKLLCMNCHMEEHHPQCVLPRSNH